VDRRAVAAEHGLSHAFEIDDHRGHRVLLRARSTDSPASSFASADSF
jgi:hypothetical protein